MLTQHTEYGSRTIEADDIGIYLPALDRDGIPTRTTGTPRFTVQYADYAEHSSESGPYGDRTISRIEIDPADWLDFLTLCRSEDDHTISLTLAQAEAHIATHLDPEHPTLTNR